MESSLDEEGRAGNGYCSQYRYDYGGFGNNLGMDYWP